MSRDGCVALPRRAMGLIYLRFVIVVFPDNTHYFGLQNNFEQSPAIYFSSDQ